MKISNPVSLRYTTKEIEWGNIPHIEWEAACNEVSSLLRDVRIGTGKLNFAIQDGKLYWANKSKTNIWIFDVDETATERLNFINYQIQQRAKKILENHLKNNEIAFKYDYFSYSYGHKSGSDKSKDCVASYQGDKKGYCTYWDYTPPDRGYGYDGCSQGVSYDDVKKEAESYENLCEKIQSDFQNKKCVILEYSYFSHQSHCVYGQAARNYFRFAVHVPTKKGIKTWYFDAEPFLERVVFQEYSNLIVELPKNADNKIKQFWDSGNKDLAIALFLKGKPEWLINAVTFFNNINK